MELILDVLKYTTAIHGVLYAMMAGACMMLQLSVESWDFLELSHLLVVLHLDKELVPSGWVMWDVQVVRPA